MHGMSWMFPEADTCVVWSDSTADPCMASQGAWFSAHNPCALHCDDRPRAPEKTASKALDQTQHYCVRPYWTVCCSHRNTMISGKHIRQGNSQGFQNHVSSPLKRPGFAFSLGSPHPCSWAVSLPTTVLNFSSASPRIRFQLNLSP